jgi:hypothetical protein
MVLRTTFVRYAMTLFLHPLHGSVKNVLLSYSLGPIYWSKLCKHYESGGLWI